MSTNYAERASRDFRAECDDVEREHLLDCIRTIRKHYDAALKPYFDRLIAIESRRPQPLIIVPAEVWELATRPHDSDDKGGL